MSEWQWWSGSSEEHYRSGPMDSREAAIEALEGEGGWITEAQQKMIALSDSFDAARFIEDAEDDIEHNEEGDMIFDVAPDQIDDLTARGKAMVEQWQKDHGLVFNPYYFTSQRNTEYVDATE